MAAIFAAFVGGAVALPSVLHIGLILVTAMVVGGLWGGLAGVLYTHRGVNEVIGTIMLNGVALGVIAWLVRRWQAEGDIVQVGVGTEPIAESGLLPNLNFIPELFGDLRANEELTGVLVIAIIVGVVYYLLLNRTVFGYDLRASGLNPLAGARRRRPASQDGSRRNVHVWCSWRTRRYGRDLRQDQIRPQLCGLPGVQRHCRSSVGTQQPSRDRGRRAAVGFPRRHLGHLASHANRAQRDHRHHARRDPAHGCDRLRSGQTHARTHRSSPDGGATRGGNFMSLLSRVNKLSTPVRWMIYAALGIFGLVIVQSFTDASKLTTTTTSGAMLRWTVPVMLAGLGGMFSERAGVVNIALDGIMVLGMWFGAWGTINYGPWNGLLIGLAGGALGGLIHAIATVTFGVDHIISGVAILIAAPGIARFLSLEIMAGHDGGSITQSPRLSGAGKFTLPFLAGGRIGDWRSPDILGWFTDKDWWYISDLTGFARGFVFNLSIFTIIAFSLVPLSAWLLWRTRFGLRLRICGEHPTAGESQGINIYLYKYIGVILSGVLAGFAGAFIATPELNGIYLEGSVNQRGFIGLAALIIGNWRPAGVMAGAMLFGYPFALGLRDLDGSNTHALLLVAAGVLAVVSINNFRHGNRTDAFLGGLIGVLALVWFVGSETVPNWFINILPQLIVLLVLTFFSQRLRMPAADGQPYRRGKT